MAKNIRIGIDTERYIPPTEDDVADAKGFMLERERNKETLKERVEELLALAAMRVIGICYRYMTDPRSFTISADYSETMMDEITEVMDALEDDILNLIHEYSTRATDDRERMMLISAWIASLGRGNRNLSDTLHAYLLKTLRDWEAAAVAMRFMGLGVTEAQTRVRTYIRSIYTIPEVLAAFRRSGDFTAPMIRFRGVTSGAVGLSNNGSVNVLNMAAITLQMAWMRSQAMDFERDGVSGYFQLRGSDYPCDICDDETGFHSDIREIYDKPYPHPNCCCYRVPVYERIIDGLT